MTTRIEMQQAPQSAPSLFSKLLRVSPLAMLASTVANLGIYAVAGRLSPAVSAWSGAGPGQIVGATVVYLLMGAIAAAAVARISQNPVRHFTVLATVGLLLSMALPIGALFGYGTPPGTPPAEVVTAITLGLMHIVSYAISLPLFNRLALGEMGTTS